MTDLYSEWRDFYAEKVRSWMSLEELRAECGKLQTVDSPSPELLLVHAMHKLEELQAEVERLSALLGQTEHSLANIANAQYLRAERDALAAENERLRTSAVSWSLEASKYAKKLDKAREREARQAERLRLATHRKDGQPLYVTPIAAQAAEIEALRAEVEEWKSVASAQAELHFEAEVRERAKAKALAELISWIPAADVYRRLGFDPEAPMRALERANQALAGGGLSND